MEFTRQYLDGRPTVLVVDSVTGRGSLAAALEAVEGYDVTTVSTVDEAVDALDERTCAVVLPQSLPGTTGAALAERIAAARPAVPVVLCPTTVDEGVIDATRTAVDAVVVPSALDDLDETVTDLAATYLADRGHELKADAFDQLFSAVDDTVFVKNDRAEHLKLDADEPGPSNEEAFGKTDRELHDSRFGLGEAWYADDMAVLDGDEIVQAVKSYSDGEITFHLEQTRVPWRDESGEIRGIVGHSRNVTREVSSREELEQKNRRLDQFASYLSHDLQNPLQVADGYLTLAREGDEAALDEIESALARMERLIEDIQVLAKGERDTKSELRNVDFVEAIETVWDLVPKRDATLEIDVPDGTIINAARRELRPMLENLVKNALDHGGDDVAIRVGTGNDGFFIADDGPGIPPGERSEIFEQGFTTSDSGTGTGLAIVSEVVDGHDWEIDVSESADGGARFEIHNCLLVPDPDRSPATGEPIELSEATDVGDVLEPGEASYDADADEWTITASGSDIWGHENEFHYAYTRVDGDVRLQCRVSDIESVTDFSKAGLMLRASLDEHAPHAHIGSTPEFGTEVLWRTDADARTTSQHLEEDDDFEWFRLDREGDRVTCSVSMDGEVWEPIDQRQVPLGDEIYVGLAVCSVVSRQTCTATLDNVRVRRLDAGE